MSGKKQPRNVAARALADPLFRQRVIDPKKGRKVYTRKVKHAGLDRHDFEKPDCKNAARKLSDGVFYGRLTPTRKLCGSSSWHDAGQQSFIF